MFVCKSEKASLWRQVVQRKMVFKKKCLNHSVTLLQQSSDKRDAELFHYFGYKKYISCLCRCEFDGRKCNAKQNWNIDNCHGECKKTINDPVYKEDYACNLSICMCLRI